MGMGKCFEGKRVVGTRKKHIRIEVIIHEHVFKNCFVGWMVVFKTFLKIYPHHFYLVLSSDARIALSDNNKITKVGRFAVTHGRQ